MSPRLLIACLCAEWCGTCRDYREVFETLRQSLPGHDWHWIDVEDQAELAGDLDVETFPTLLIAHQGTVLFGGPVLPRVADGQRLIEALVADLRAGRRVTPRVAPEEAPAFAEIARALGKA